MTGRESGNDACQWERQYPTAVALSLTERRENLGGLISAACDDCGRVDPFVVPIPMMYLLHL